MRPLKTLFPCRHCGTPSQVRHLREVEHVLCPRCGERARCFRVSVLCDELGRSKGRDANGCGAAGNTHGFIEGWLEALEKRLTAARHVMKGLPMLDDRRVRWRHALALKDRLAYVRRTLEQLEPFAEDVIDDTAGFEVIQGGAPPRQGELEIGPPSERPSHVRLVSPLEI